MVDMLAGAPPRLPRASLKWLGSAIVAALTLAALEAALAARAADLAAGLVDVAFDWARVKLVPGLSGTDEAGVAEVGDPLALDPVAVLLGILSLTTLFDVATIA